MTHAYDPALAERAARTLGRMLDFSVYSLHGDVASMMDLFTACGLARLFENGDIRTIAGISGIELAYGILDRSGLAYERTAPRHTISLSPEFWCGYTLAMIQCKACLPFDAIMRRFDHSGFMSDYVDQRTSYLESLDLSMDADKRSAALRAFGAGYSGDAVSRFLAEEHAGTGNAAGCSLKSMRIKNGLSQSGLAKAAGIPVRTIQQYEQGQKDLSKAGAGYLIALSRVLNCPPEILLRPSR